MYRSAPLYTVVHAITRHDSSTFCGPPPLAPRHFSHNYKFGANSARSPPGCRRYRGITG